MFPVNFPTPILIAAINARHSHASMGARCLLANMGELRVQTELAEFTLQQSAAEIAAAIAAHAPRILGLGVYIWNAARVAELLPLLRQQSPQTKIVLGGPEIMDNTAADFLSCCSRPRWGRGLNSPAVSERPPYLENQTNPGVNAPGYNEAALDAAYFILGEGDLAFAALCRDLLAGKPIERILRPAPPDLVAIRLPYDEYTDADLARRLLYVESSRGCAMRCDYCVSANDEAVRYFPMTALLAAFDRLLARGARQFKFCDRSFNLDIPRAVEILAFFRERQPQYPGLFLHFEMYPDRFPAALREALAAFPPRSLQLEIGLQSFNPQVLETIRRPQDLERAAENLRFLRAQTHAWLHTDLIAGLPGETLDSFAAGFDRLVALDPHEIQLGILKKLPGAPIARHDDAFAMRYNPEPPYDILSTRDWPAEQLARTARFAHYWDAIVNSQRFIPSAPLIWNGAASIFAAFMEFADWMGARFPREHGVALADLVTAVFQFLTRVRGLSPETAADALLRGYRHAGARDIPPALAPHISREPPQPGHDLPKALRRQFLRWTWEERQPTL